MIDHPIKGRCGRCERCVASHTIFEDDRWWKLIVSPSGIMHLPGDRIHDPMATRCGIDATGKKWHHLLRGDSA